MERTFSHLRLHTEYSLIDSVVRIGPLMTEAAAMDMPALAITDHVNLFGLVKFFSAAQKVGIKPIAGVDLLVGEGEGDPPSRVTLLCQSEDGYRNLTRLVTRAYRDGQRRGQPLVERQWIEAVSDGLIALSGGNDCDVARALAAAREAQAESCLAFWQRVFPDRYYFELTRTGRAGEEDWIHGAVALADHAGVPLVATNDVRFLSVDDYQAHEVRVCINSGRTLADSRRPREYSPQQYLRSPQEMAALFADIPDALDNAVEIAQRCNLSLQLGNSFLPRFEVPQGQSTESYLHAQARSGLEARLARITAVGGRVDTTAYEQRLSRELDVIQRMGFAGYFLIVSDFIQWARDNDIPVGPGRGSGAGSLVAYSLGITDLDPISYDLLFERFLNPERVSMPDFDIDFCMEGRDRVIDYVARCYGRDRVAQIITFGSMAAKAVVRDVGRVLGHPYGYVDRIAKLIPFELGMTLDKALTQEPELAELYAKDEEVQALLDLARSLEGVTRNAGKHAGGVVIAPSPLTDFTPLYCEAGGEGLVSQFDKDDVERVGLVKFDFLGLRTLTIIERAVQNIRRAQKADGPALDIRRIPLDDPETYALLRRQETTAVFQLESRGMKDLIKRLQPDNFEEIVALVALFRPGPLQSGMVDDFINRKHGRAAVAYPDPALEPILKPTYGVILYQEQVMQIAQVLAGYSLGGADLLRRAMGKKKPEEMAKQREVFLAGAVANGVDEASASHIFDLMEKFAGYGFNKSHSAAYALLSYQTAYLKAHYPAEFMAAVLSADMDNTDKVVTLIDECRRMRLTVMPPDVNVSAYDFRAVDAGTLRYGLGAIKGVGHSAIESILAERATGGQFSDLTALCSRVDLRKVNRRVLEAMIRAGALDSLGDSRAGLLARLDATLKLAEQHVRADLLGQADFFGLQRPAAEVIARQAPEGVKWPEHERLRAEKETLGLYLTGHPIIAYESELKQFTSGRLADLAEAIGSDANPEQAFAQGRSNRLVVVAGLIVTLRRQAGKRAFVTLDDRSGRIEVPVFEREYQQYKTLLVKDRLLVVEGVLGYDDFSGGIRLSPKHIMGLDEARARFARALEIRVGNEPAVAGLVEQMEAILNVHKGGDCPIWVVYRNGQAATRLRLGAQWRVRPCSELLSELRGCFGEKAVILRYGAVSDRRHASSAFAVGASG